LILYLDYILAQFESKVKKKDQEVQTKATEAPPQLSGCAAQSGSMVKEKEISGSLINTFPSPTK
jgi:hypothetical protein